MSSFREALLLTAEECEAIVKEHINYEDTKVFNYSGELLDKETIEKYRGLRKESTIPLSGTLREMLLEKLKVFGIVSIPDYNMIVRYDTGEECKKHSDVGRDSITGKRIKTVIIQLSDEQEYTGGTLVVEGIEDRNASKQQGTVIMFDSYLDHYVTKVDSGSRLAQVIWLNEDNLGLKKRIL